MTLWGFALSRIFYPFCRRIFSILPLDERVPFAIGLADPPLDIPSTVGLFLPFFLPSLVLRSPPFPPFLQEAAAMGCFPPPQFLTRKGPLPLRSLPPHSPRISGPCGRAGFGFRTDLFFAAAEPPTPFPYISGRLNENSSFSRLTTFYRDDSRLPELHWRCRAVFSLPQGYRWLPFSSKACERSFIFSFYYSCRSFSSV